MATHKSAKKRSRQNERRRLRNQQALSQIKTLVKGVRKAENKDTAEVKLKEAISFLDKQVSKGRVHKNNAARQKSKLTKYVNSLDTAK